MPANDGATRRDTKVVTDERLACGQVGEKGVSPDHLDKGLCLPVEPRCLHLLSFFGALFGKFDASRPTTPGRLRQRTPSEAPSCPPRWTRPSRGCY